MAMGIYFIMDAGKYHFIIAGISNWPGTVIIAVYTRPGDWAPRCSGSPQVEFTTELCINNPGPLRNQLWEYDRLKSCNGGSYGRILIRNSQIAIHLSDGTRTYRYNLGSVRYSCRGIELSCGIFSGRYRGPGVYP